MKILLVIPTMTQGGAERVMSVLANDWADKGHDIVLVLLAKGEKAYSLRENIKIIELGFENRGKLTRIFDELKIFFSLRKILKTESHDFVLSFMAKYNSFTLLAASFVNLNVYVSDRNNPKNKLPLFTSLLRKLTYKHAQGIIAQTALAKEIIKKETGNKNIEIIPNPIKVINFYNDVKREKIILNIGRLHSQKGQIYLLEIFAKVKSADWKLVILGSGHLLESLQMKAKELQIEDQVDFRGNVSNVDEWYARSSIFAFTSLYEGFPNALAEAMAAGLPCISFDCETGPSELIKDAENGYLVPVRDLDAFTDKLELLMRNNELRKKIGNEAMELREKLESPKIADKFIAFCTMSAMKN
jgi:glycosyltransferase involved in cell wall biosynthesis